jgi:hypothetical protein
MSLQIDVSGVPGPLLAAAIVAAVTRLEQERAAAAAVPPTPPTQGQWVLSGRPRSVQPETTRRPSASRGWSVGSQETQEDDPLA